MIYNYVNIVAGGPTTTVIKTVQGVLGAIVINKAAANAIIAIYDGISADGTLIGTITMPETLLKSQDVLVYNVAFSTGLTIVTTTTQDITVTYE